jgi:hypothetical protein
MGLSRAEPDAATLSPDGASAMAPAPTAPRAQVDPTPTRVGWSLAAGLATALVPLAVGGAIFALRDDVGAKQAAVYTMSFGMALAPVVSHLTAREWKRAAIFGAFPMAFSLATLTLLQIQPSVTIYGEPDTRLLFGLFLGFTAITSGGGLVDSLLAGERARPPRIALTPTVGRGTYGFQLGGVL